MVATIVSEQKFLCETIDHFRVALNLIMKARLSAKFLLWKLVFIRMQTKLIFILSFALSLAFIVRFTATRKWPIEQPYDVMKSKMAVAKKFESKIWRNQVLFCATQTYFHFSNEIWI